MWVVGREAQEEVEEPSFIGCVKRTTDEDVQLLSGLREKAFGCRQPRSHMHTHPQLPTTPTVIDTPHAHTPTHTTTHNHMPPPPPHTHKHTQTFVISSPSGFTQIPGGGEL